MLSKLAFTVLLASTTFAGDWQNAGGNTGRNGLTSEVGPETPNLLWSGGRPSIIAWQPVTEGRRVFMVRQTGFPTDPDVLTNSPVVAMDIRTGAELWIRNIPFNAGEWTTWIAGVKDGRVFACRGGNGASSSAKVYALDVTDGSTLWTSVDLVDAGAYDGATFAPNGDLIVASFTDVWRIRALDGTTVWHTLRTCSVSSSCGPAVHGNAVYLVDAVAGGHVVKKYDLATGAYQYQSPIMPGFLVQNSPMVGPDGTVYFNRVQNNPATDFFYAFEDNGAAFVQKWNVPAGYNTSVEYAVGPDGSVYMMGVGDVLQRLDPTTGAVLDAFGMGTSSSVRMATDVLGRVFVSNGEFAAGRFYCFEADLTPRWSTPVTNINIGAPALGHDGILVVAGIGNDVRAYRNAEPGAGFCFGVGCPCGNDSATTGCVNSTGAGALLSGAGSTSVAADDLVLTSTGCPPNNTGLYFMGAATLPPVFVGDGLACTGGLFRYFPGAVTPGGVFTRATPVASAFAGAITPRDTRFFQSWTRDVLCGPPPAPCPTPCGMNSNLSNGYAVTFTP